MCACYQFLAADSLPDLTREYIYTLQSVHQLTATICQIRQIRSQVHIYILFRFNVINTVTLSCSVMYGS